MKDINAMAKAIYEQNKAVGWWDDPNRCIFTTIQLINTEIAEATEGERKNLMDDHLPHRKMGEVELADALIRTLDLAGRMGVIFDIKQLNTFISEFQVDDDFNKNIYFAHLILTATSCSLGMSLKGCDAPYSKWDDEVVEIFNVLVAALLATASLYDYDIWAAMEEKLEYNKHRADHKRENRAKENGKKV